MSLSRVRPAHTDTPDVDRRVTKPGEHMRKTGLAVAESVQEAPEDAAFPGQRGGRGRGDRMLPGHRLVIVGPRDGVDDLFLIEVLGSFDLGHEPDEHPVAHHLSLEAGGAVGVPFRFAAPGKRHAHPELPDARPHQVSVDATVAQRIDDPSCPVLLHPP